MEQQLVSALAMTQPEQVPFEVSIMGKKYDDLSRLMYNITNITNYLIRMSFVY